MHTQHQAVTAARVHAAHPFNALEGELRAARALARRFHAPRMDAEDQMEIMREAEDTLTPWGFAKFLDDVE